QAEAGGAGVGVGLVAEPVRTRAEQLGGGVELAVDLEPDDHLPALGQDPAGGVGGGVGHEDAPSVTAPWRASSRAAATWNMVGSARAGAMTCTPMGRPSSPVPKG